MHTAAKKLQSQRGASLIFALLVFMLCAFAGVAALVTASTNMGRYARLEQDQQHYMSTASAALLLRDQLCGHSVTLKLTLRRTEEWCLVPGAGTPAAPPVRRTRTSYTFVPRKEEPGPAGVVDVPDPANATSDAALAVYLKSSAGSGDAVKQILDTVLGDYYRDTFLQSDIPSYFYEQKNVADAGDPVAGGGTGACPAETFRTVQRRLVVEGETGSVWHDILGTVYVDFSGIGDYGVRAMVRQQYGDAENLYTTVFELPAHVTREVETLVQVKDQNSTDTAAWASALGADSYGCRIIDNTVTVTVTWPKDAPTVTRIRSY